MFISKRKVIKVLADEMASCDRYTIRALQIGFENLTDYEKEFYRMKHKIAFKLIDITLALGIYKEVTRKKNKIIIDIVTFFSNFFVDF